MSAWLAAVIALLPPLAAAGYVGLTGRVPDRLAAAEFAGTLSTLILVLMSFAFDQPSFLDLPLALVFLSLPGMLVFAHFFERWL